MAERRICVIEGCDKTVFARGYCRPHWYRWRTYGNPLSNPPPIRYEGECHVEGCGSPIRVKSVGLCMKHYQRKQKYGDVHFSKIDREQTGKHCKIDGCTNKSGRKGMCQKHYRRVVTRGSACDSSLSPKYRRRIKWIEGNASYDGDDCLKWPFSVSAHGRGTVSVNRKQIPAPRYMCILAHGDPPTPEHEAAHSCGNGHLGCMNPRHLRWATSKENERDKILHGTLRKGEQINTNKLTESQVREIRKIGRSESGVALAKRYGVNPSTISQILLRQSWRWLG